ncbi:MAG: cell division protein FtsX [Gammaproteobacteria bacterium]|nr:cell division protein FtsX [Gammaproteobacteria bacterium]
MTRTTSKAQVKMGASSQKVSISSRLKMFFHLHRQEISNSLNVMLKTPIASFMTLAVLGIALALPGGLQVILKNSNMLSEGWDGASRFSLYLVESVSDDAAASLGNRLRSRSDIAEVLLISREKALEEFQSTSGLGDVLQQLEENPLPIVLEILPAENSSTPEASQSMLEEFKKLPEVEFAQLDMQWVKRLYYLLDLADRAAFALALLLGVAVLLIVGNTIRLAIQNRREEIEIIKLIGATNAFIRRPFLYTGLWYGFGGGIFAISLIGISLWWLSDPVSQLAGLYESGYRLAGLSFVETLELLGFSTLLGLVGAWVSVTRHLSQINPS